MVPYELTLRNFMCYRGDLPPLRLDGLHVACLSGDNGAGKSALLDAITWALWGKARMSDDELIAQGESDMQVDLSFQLDGQLYRVSRRRQRGKTTRSGKQGAGKSALEFQIWDEPRWRALGEQTTSETERKIEQVLRMKYDTFINASFLLQGRADEFTRKTPGERKQVLADILDLRDYAALETRARERARATSEQIRGLEGAIGVLQQEADKLDLYGRLVAEAEASVARHTADLAAAEQARREADDALRALEASSTRRDTVRLRLAELRAEQQQQQHELDDLRREIADDEAVLSRSDEIAAGVAALNAARRELERLDELRPRYDALHEQRRDLQDRLKDELRTLQRELDRRQDEAARLRDQLARRPQAQAELEDAMQRLAQLAPLLEEQARLREQRSTLDAQVKQVHTLTLRHRELDAALARRHDALLAARDEQQRSIERLDGLLRDAARQQADLDQARAQQRTLEESTRQLAQARERERATTEQASALRALCEQFTQRAEQVKQRQHVLEEEHTTSCPLCGSDLGAAGMATIAEHYAQELADLRQRYRESKREAEQHEASLHSLREATNQAEASVAAAQQSAARIAPLEQQVAQAQAWQAEHAEARQALDELNQQLARQDYDPDTRAELRAIEGELAALASAAQEGAAWAEAAQHLEQQRATLDAQLAACEQQLAARPGLESSAAALRRELEQLEQAAAALPVAEEQAAHLAETIQRGEFAPEIRQAGRAIEGELAALGYSAEAYAAARSQAQELAHWAEEERRRDLAYSRLEGNRRAFARAAELLERRAAELTALDEEAARLDEELRALPAARQRATACAQAAEERRRHLDVAQRDLAEKQSLQRRAHEAGEQLAQKQQERDALAGRQGVFQELAEACGKRGVQAMLIETAIPEIEREANRLLGQITGNQMHLTFEMQRSTRKGDTVETLDIRIADALGTRAYDAFSGGEATRINFAIRIALSRLLAARAGARLETLVIDEGMSALDAEGRERFVEAITSVQHDFRRILVITHLEDLKDRFPARIEISKAAGGSTWALL
jgi:exonuclease SbcC